MSNFELQTPSGEQNLKAMEKMAKYENIAIGMILVDPNLLMTVPFEISIFKRWAHVVGVIMGQLNKGITPDLITVTDEFPNDPDLLPTLGMLANTTISTANYKYYIDNLTELSLNVGMYRHMQAAMKQVANGEPVREVFGNLISQALTMASSKKPKYSYSAKEFMRAMADRLEEIYDDKDRGNDKVRTGIAKVDNVIGAFHPSDLVVIGARPAQGKTAVGVTIALNNALQGKKVGFISTEMSVEQLAFRMASQRSGLMATKFRNCDFYDSEWPVVARAVSEISELDIRICDKTLMRVSEVTMQCRAWDMDGGIDVVIVDYLTRIKPDKDIGNQNLNIGEVVTQLKNLARTLDIPVITLAQLNRDSAKRADKKPAMADLRDSGIIEQEADCILLLHREEKDGMPDENLIIVEKNRHGESNYVLDVNFDGRCMRWS